jgi:hypothetical protein
MEKAMKKLSHLFLIALILVVTGCAHKSGPYVLSSKLGKSISSEEIQRWLSELGDLPEIRKFDDAYYYSYKSKGISLNFDTKDTLINIFLYAEGVDGFQQYQGVLPFKLSFTKNRKEIEASIGKPEITGGAGVINYWGDYTSKGFGITYNSKRLDNLKTEINTISIFLIEKHL